MQVTTHWFPLPWLPHGEGVDSVRYMLELHTPAHEVLDGLRQNTYHPRCELGQLAQQVTLMVNKTTRHRPLGVVGVWRRAVVPGGALEPRELNDLALMIAAHSGRQLLIPMADQGPVLPEAALTIPQLLLLHHPALPLKREYPSSRIVARSRINIHCGSSREVVQLSLVRAP